MLTCRRLSMFMIILLYILYSANSTLTNGRYYKGHGSISLAQNSVYSVKARSVIECSARCLVEKCSCYSFESKLKTCETGTCIAANSSTETSKQFYLSCDLNDGFKSLVYGSITACVWMSTQPVNYSMAISACKAKSSHLYTLKTVDKLKLLQNYYGSLNFWVGLDDLETEDTFRWVDDDTTCDAALVKELFESDQPDNHQNLQHCVRYRNFRQKLDDDFCHNEHNYICEKPFFNSV